jgi:SAM-dependent methyltransferase
MTNDKQPGLTEVQYWDEYWAGYNLPSLVAYSRNHGHNQILDALTRFIDSTCGIKILEIGGAPGQYLAFMLTKFAAAGYVIDFSSVGIEATRRNFEMLNLPVNVIHADIFDNTIKGEYDVVFSLGFIEHFHDVESVVAQHIRLAKPGGLVIVGCPNLRGVNEWFLKRLAPEMLATHNLNMMDPALWDAFERKHGLEVLLKKYVGGFEPAVFNRIERRTPKTLVLKALATAMTFAFRPKFFKRTSSPKLSQYILAVYRTPYQ